MDFHTAENLMAEILQIDKLMALLAHTINGLEEPERTDLKRGLGATMYELYSQLIRPIGEQHPELDPLKKAVLENPPVIDK